ncbi:MAG: hypothetical protein AB7F89_11805 [Pirellulaceae bacterium]
MDWTRWEWTLWASGVFIAITTLVRLMRGRRDILLDELRVEAEAEAQRQQQERKKEQRRKRRKELGDRAA